MMTIKVKVYDGVKYDMSSKKIGEHIIENVKDFEVKTMTEEEVRAEGYDMVDEHDEYLFITSEDGTRYSYRNSHVDAFREY